MYFLKRISIFILVVLLFISIYKDLSNGIKSSPRDTSNIPEQSSYAYVEPFEIIKVKTQSGDTVLSITETVNENEKMDLDITQIITDFKTINPHIDPHQLQVNTFYYFPLYEMPNQ